MVGVDHCDVPLTRCRVRGAPSWTFISVSKSLKDFKNVVFHAPGVLRVFRHDNSITRASRGLPIIVNINSGGWKIATKRRVDCVGKYWRWLSWQVEGGESWVQWAPAALWFSCQCTCCSPQCTCCSQPPESKWWNYFAMPEGISLSWGWSQTTVKRAFGRTNWMI